MRSVRLSWFKLVLLITIAAGLMLPQELIMPVKGASKTSYNAKSFWYYPWGRSGTHKGIDIFAQSGEVIKSSTYGLVLYAGNINVGGNVVLIVGPKWRLHYYAHLKNIKTSKFTWVSGGETIGSVGTSGNARGKQPHLHYAIVTIIPYIWRIDGAPQGWKKMFYLNPIDQIEGSKN